MAVPESRRRQGGSAKEAGGSIAAFVCFRRTRFGERRGMAGVKRARISL